MSGECIIFLSIQWDLYTSNIYTAMQTDRQKVLLSQQTFRTLFYTFRKSQVIYQHLVFLKFSLICQFMSCCLSIYLSIYLSVYLSICLTVYLSIYLSICPSVHLSIYLSVYLSICLSVYLSICLSAYLSICLSIYLSIYSCS